MRVERSLDSLEVTERAEILTQFFGLLVEAHRRGIVNGDVDLKHIFWHRDKRQLVVIDWGNARLGVDPNKKTEFSYDLARAGEIIFSLITRQGQPPARGSIALPDDSALIAELTPLPIEFRNLCKSAIRTPTVGAQAPHTAAELYEASKRWLAIVGPLKSHKLSQSKPGKPRRWPRVVGALLGIVLVIFLAMKISPMFPDFSFFATVSVTNIATSTEIPSSIPSAPPVLNETLVQMLTPTEISLNPTEAPISTPIIIPSPRIYTDADLNQILVFDNKVTFPSSPNCWRNASIPPKTELKEREGFFRKDDYDWWAFSIGEERAVDTTVQASLHECLDTQLIKAMALNALVTHLEPQRGDVRGREVGFFLEDQTGFRREYTLWIDKDSKMHLRVRENNIITEDDIVSVVSLANLQRDGNILNDFYKFPIQIFLEIDNQGLDILYLREAPNNAVQALDIKPDQMIPIDYAIRKRLDNIQKIGLIGYGSKTQVLIWPLAFYGNIPEQ